MRKKFFIPVIIVEVILGGLALAYIASAYWHRPLGPSLGLPDAVSAQEGNSATSGVSQAGGGTASETATKPKSLLDHLAKLINPDADSNNALCGGPSVMTILVVGSDERADDYLYGLADSIRIVRIDFNTPKVMVLDVPRDLWVEIPGISDHYGKRMSNNRFLQQD